MIRIHDRKIKCSMTKTLDTSSPVLCVPPVLTHSLWASLCYGFSPYNSQAGHSMRTTDHQPHSLLLKTGKIPPQSPETNPTPYILGSLHSKLNPEASTSYLPQI